MRYTSPLRGWRGYIFEVLIYDAALTTAQMQDVENYLLARWVLSNTHAVTHNIDTAVQPTVFPTLRGTHGMSTKGYAAPLGSTHASAAGTEVEGYAAPLGSTHDLVSALDAVASNYHPVGVPEHAITMESYLTPQIEVPASVPAGVTPRVFKRKHWAFP